MVPAHFSEHDNEMDVAFDIDQERRILTAVVTGRMCQEKSRFYFAQLGLLLEKTGISNVLIDMQSTVLSGEEMNMGRAINIASLYENTTLKRGGRVASVIPDEEARLFHTRNIATATQIKGIEYQVFTDTHSARSWLEAGS